MTILLLCLIRRRLLEDGALLQLWSADNSQLVLHVNILQKVYFTSMKRVKF